LPSENIPLDGVKRQVKQQQKKQKVNRVFQVQDNGGWTRVVMVILRQVGYCPEIPDLRDLVI